MGRVGKAQLIDTVSAQADVSKATVKRVVTLLFDAVIEELAKGNSVTVPGFGTWRSKVRTPRIGRNPKDGSAIDIPARIRVQFKAGTKLRSGVEYAIDPEIFFGAGVGSKTELEGALSHLFGWKAETFHLETATQRVAEDLGEEFEPQAQEFFDSLRDSLSVIEKLVDQDEGGTDDAPAEPVRPGDDAKP